MKPKYFRLSSRGALMAIVSAAFAHPALAATAGRVDFVFGDAALRSSSGQERPLARGAEVMDGDTLITRNGRAQIRFTDGAYVSLQPNTEFGVREYRYEGKADGKERGFFALLRGAMRTVTGAIGRFNRNAYQVRTPTATVGIRGTGGLIEILPDLATLIRGSSGIWILSNPAGQIDVPAGTSGIAPPDPKEPPKPTGQAPSAPPPPPTSDPTFRQSDETTADGRACVVTATCESLGTPLISGPGFHISYAFGTTTGSSIGSSTGLADATFNAAGQLTAWTDSSGVTSFSGTHMEGGAVAGVMGWGRWTGPATLPARAAPTFGANEGFHYVAGLPTTTMPTTGTVGFTLIGSTSPTGSDGKIAPGTLASGTLTADFLASRVTIGINPSFGTWGYNSSMTGNISGASMAGGGTANEINTAPAAYSCGGSSCNASFQGAFFGAGASNAGFAYQVSNFGGSATVSGVAVFKQ
jgi:FecR protein